MPEMVFTEMVGRDGGRIRKLGAGSGTKLGRFAAATDGEEIGRIFSGARIGSAGRQAASIRTASGRIFVNMTGMHKVKRGSRARARTAWKLQRGCERARFPR